MKNTVFITSYHISKQKYFIILVLYTRNNIPHITTSLIPLTTKLIRKYLHTALDTIFNHQPIIEPFYIF